MATVDLGLVKGDKGDKGDTGAKGERGDTGANVSIKTYQGVVSGVTETMLLNLISATTTYSFSDDTVRTIALISVDTDNSDYNSFGYYRMTSSTGEGSFVKGSSPEIITVKYFG